MDVIPTLLTHNMDQICNRNEEGSNGRVSEISIKKSEADTSARNPECFGHSSNTLINGIEYEENNRDLLCINILDAESEQLSIFNEHGLLPLPLDSHTPITLQALRELQVRQGLHDPIRTGTDPFFPVIQEDHSIIQEREESRRSDTNEENFPCNTSVVSDQDEIQTVEETCDWSSSFSKDEICEIVEKPLQFETCEIEFVPESVNGHTGETSCNSETDVPVKAMNIRTKKKSHECETCGKCFDRKSRLTIHKSSHVKEKQFECETCGNCFQFLSTLKEHKKLHTGGYQFKCEKCDKSFSASRNLKIHNVLHTKKRYGCETCKKLFASDSDLTIHRMSHTNSGRKPYKCETCGRCFAQPYLLTRHKSCHTGQTIANVGCVENGSQGNQIFLLPVYFIVLENKNGI